MPTLLTYRQALAASLDDIGIFTVGSSSGTTVVLDPLLSATANASSRRYDGRYLYVNSGAGAGRQAVVRPGSYVPSTGQLTTFNDSGWNAVLTPGSGIEITGLFPGAPGLVGEETDYRTLLNRGLGRLLIEDRVDVTTVADQYTYAFAAATYPYLDRMTRIIGVYDPPRATGLPRRETWRRHQWKIDAGALTLEFTDRPYATSGATFQVAVLRPANTLISGADSTTGLVNDTDTAVPTVEEVVTAARPYAFEALLARSKGRPSGDWAGEYERALEAARGLARWDRTVDATPAPAERGAA